MPTDAGTPDVPPVHDPLSDEPLSEEPLELSDLLNTALDKGVVVHGEVMLAVADVDLVKLNVGLLLSALETIERRHGSGPRASLSATLGPPDLRPLEARLGDALRPAPEGQDTVSRDRAGSGGHAELEAAAPNLPSRINADAAGPESGLARLVLTLIEVLRKVLEHQAVRRMDGGRLSEAEVERLGLALSRLNDRMQELKGVFGLSDEDLQIDLGPLGRVR